MVSGYAGGDEGNASYLSVAKGDTKHREAIQKRFWKRGVC